MRLNASVRRQRPPHRLQLRQIGHSAPKAEQGPDTGKVSLIEFYTGPPLYMPDGRAATRA